MVIPDISLFSLNRFNYVRLLLFVLYNLNMTVNTCYHSEAFELPSILYSFTF